MKLTEEELGYLKDAAARYRSVADYLDRLIAGTDKPLDLSDRFRELAEKARNGRNYMLMAHTSIIRRGMRQERA